MLTIKIIFYRQTGAVSRKVLNAQYAQLRLCVAKENCESSGV